MRALVLVALLADPAAAGAWTTRDLGQTYREADCVEAAARALEETALTFGGGGVRTTGWTASAEDLQRRGYDALVTCAYGASSKTRATLVIHSPRDDFGATVLARQIETLWRVHARRLDEAYVDSFRD